MKVQSKKKKKWQRLLEKLEQRCLQPIDEFKKLGTVTDTINGPLIHIDRGSKIIAAAHLDTVAHYVPRKVLWQNSKYKDGSKGLPIIQSIQLDDRLGVWMLLDLLPAMGMEFDVLLCDGEECGCSTASSFKADREYNWGFEFDRAGTDVVLYDYEDDKAWENAIDAHGFTLGMGSFSDISELTGVGCCFANFGTGYRHQHSSQCHAYLDDTVLMALEFETWFKSQKDTRYPYTHNPKDYGFGWYRRLDRFTTRNDHRVLFNDDEWQAVFCPHCGQQNWTAGRLSHKQCVACRKMFPVDLHKNRVDDIPKCPWCQSRQWDDTGCCEICGYDQVLDVGKPEKDGLIYDTDDDCPYCGRSLPDDGYCDYCGFTELLPP